MVTTFPFKSRRLFRTDGRDGGVNSDSTFMVKIESVGKGRSQESEYLIANEWIAANICQFLRLPVPPFAIVRKKSRSTTMFISQSYEGDSTPSDVNPANLYRGFPKETTGVVVFDIFIANCDRHGGNLKVDNPLKPRQFHLIDHERALFYIYKGEGIKRLQGREDRLGISDGSQSADEYHCLIEELDSIEHLQFWIDRVASIPDWFIEDICEDVKKVACKSSECEYLKKFLKERKTKLQTLIQNNKSRFPRISKWPLIL